MGEGALAEQAKENRMTYIPHTTTQKPVPLKTQKELYEYRRPECTPISFWHAAAFSGFDLPVRMNSEGMTGNA